MKKCHPCCERCTFGCKKPYAEWTFNVPCTEFCSYYEEKEFGYKSDRWKKF